MWLQHAGHEQMQDVVSLVFAYINMLAAPGGVSDKRFDENKALAELRFKFADKVSPYTYAERLSSAMQTYQARYHLFFLVCDTNMRPQCKVTWQAFTCTDMK